MLESGHTVSALDSGFVRYIDHMGSDERVVEAARISYRSPSKGEDADRKLLNYLFKNKHTSPFEMCKITFNVKMPIFVMRQWVRHRMQNLNEVSARYTELPDEFYRPTEWRVQDASNKQSSVASDSIKKSLADDILEKEDEPPLPDGRGQAYLMPMNMTLATKDGQAPPLPEPAAQGR